MSVIESDSSVYKTTFYGILNGHGAFWSPLAFESPEKARKRVEEFFADKPETLAQCLEKFTFVPVRARLETVEDEETSLEAHCFRLSWITSDGGIGTTSIDPFAGKPLQKFNDKCAEIDVTACILVQRHGDKTYVIRRM